MEERLDLGSTRRVVKVGGQYQPIAIPHGQHQRLLVQPGADGGELFVQHQHDEQALLCPLRVFRRDPHARPRQSEQPIKGKRFLGLYMRIFVTGCGLKPLIG